MEQATTIEPIVSTPRTKRAFSALTMEEAIQLVPSENLLTWEVVVSQRPPSGTLLDTLRRLESFELFASEAAKVLLTDIILAEVVPDYPQLKVWKSAPLESPTVAGVADYLIAPRRAYIKTPLLCAIEAKKDDFEAGQIQCIAEMAVCLHNNRREGHDTEVYGIVSNGQGWVFYKLTRTCEVFVSGLFTTSDLPTLLGVLDLVCAACIANIPVSSSQAQSPSV
jgi:hypothetical protein